MHLPTDYQTFIHQSRYARWLPDEGRRETWDETVDRYMENVVEDKVEVRTKVALREAILNLEVMPSMRALMTAGPALDRDNVAGFNCAYLPVDHPRAFDETLYILMCGTGVGFSVERANVSKLPEVPHELKANPDEIIHVADSKIGWAKALRALVNHLYAGCIPTWDTSGLRPSGAPLKTFGGRSSGPKPLEELFDFVVETFKAAKGDKLTTLQCHDIMCKIGDVVVVGGVRRSALISLSNLGDDRMRYAKSGQWWEDEPQRALANNSIAYTSKPDTGAFMREWSALYESKSGERGIFNREASRRTVEKYHKRDPNHEWGTNPCSEIILRPNQFCNLTEVVVRADDTKGTLTKKVKLAAILGTLQAGLTDFRYLRPIWKKNTDEEALLGLSLTGIMDNIELITQSNGGFLQTLRKLAERTNAQMAEELGINKSAAITCVKPSGTVSQLVDSASGIHTRHSPYYTRTVRGDNNDPLTKFMKDQGVPNEPDVMKPDNTTVFSFPVKAPSGSLCRDDLGAIQQLEIWKLVQENWCEHKPSITVSVKEDEWLDVGAWVYRHFDSISGISFLPHSDHSYKQAPYQEVTKGEYLSLKKASPEQLSWEDLKDFEQSDRTIGTQSLACTADSCEVVDIGS